MNVIKKINGDKVRESLCYLEHAYTPILSKRIPNFNEYVDKLCNCADNYAIYSDEGEILGYIGFYANDVTTKAGYISQLVVNPQVQRNGIGKKLVEICFAIAKNRGMETMRLEVRNDNKNAIKFYEKIGFCQENTNEKSQYMKCSIMHFNGNLKLEGMENE